MKYVVIGAQAKARAKRNPLFDKLGNLRKTYTPVTSVEVALATIKYLRRVKHFIGDSIQLADKLKLGCSPRVLGRLLDKERARLFVAGYGFRSSKFPKLNKVLLILEPIGKPVSPAVYAATVEKLWADEAEYRKKAYARSVGEETKRERATVTAIFRFMNAYTLACDSAVWVGDTNHLWQEMADGVHLPRKRAATPKYLQELGSSRALIKCLQKEHVLKQLKRKGVAVALREDTIKQKYWVISWHKAASYKALAEKKEEYYTKLKEEETNGTVE